MTATVLERTPLRVTTRPSLARLTEVELRKMADTRAGRVLLGVTVLVSVALLVVILFAAEPTDLRFSDLYLTALLPSAVLVPVLGILVVTGEWNHRTALTTFTLVPARERVALAKLLAGMLIGLASVAVGLVLGAVANLVGMLAFDGDGSWSFQLSLLGGTILGQMLNVVMGIGFGMLLMNSALAIVVYFMLPTVWGILTSSVHAVEKWNRWLNVGDATSPLYENGWPSEVEWARIGVSVGVWVVVPLVLGTLRLLRREVN